MANDYFDYQPTQSELNAFIKSNLGYLEPPKLLKKAKATHGSLVLVEGKNRTIIKNDLPIALLNSIKTKMVAEGYKRKNLKIEHKI